MTKQFFSVLLVMISPFCYAGGTSDTTSQPSALQSHEIRIMTYNIKMLPRGANGFLHHHPVVRAKLIPAKLISENPDVIVFQEAFDGMAIKALKKGLQKEYPYMAGNENRKVISYKRAGGVLMFSKYPMKSIESIRYTECKGVDCIGNKGAMLVEVDHPAHKFQLLGTHMQAGGSVELKASQYRDAAELLKRHQQSGVVQFIAGDFNTHKDDTTRYPRLVGELAAKDGDVDDEDKAITAHTLNDMRTKNGVPRQKRGLIDYVFIKENGVKFTSISRYAREFEQRWSSEHKDLSDHFAVILKVTL